MYLYVEPFLYKKSRLSQYDKDNDYSNPIMFLYFTELCYSPLNYFARECMPPYDMFYEDKTNYKIRWNMVNESGIKKYKTWCYELFHCLYRKYLTFYRWPVPKSCIYRHDVRKHLWNILLFWKTIFKNLMVHVECLG